MTNKEAIILLQQHISIHGITESGRWVNVNKAMELGVQALEKQEPKKPNNSTSYKYSGECFICGALVGAGEKYCDYCGQAIDWGAVDDK